MRILVVAKDFKPNLGGIAEYTDQVAKQLRLAGNGILVITRVIPGDVEFDSNCSYDVRRYAWESLGNSTFSRLREKARIITAVAKDFPADIILCNALNSWPIICRFVARRLHIPFGVITYGTDVYRDFSPSKRGFIEQLSNTKKRVSRSIVLKSADVVICISSFTRDAVINLGVENNRIIVTPPGTEYVSNGSILDCEQIFDLNLEPNRRPLLTVSRLVERKGIDKAIEAIAQVRKRFPDVLYFVAGDGEDKERLEALIDALDLWSHVILLGNVTDAEKQCLFQLAELFIMPNRELTDGDIEGFGIVFLEANAFGKPVIGGKSGGAVDAIVDGVTGILVDPLDVQEIVSAITQLLEDRELAQKMGFEGRKRVEKQFTWNYLVTQMHHDLVTLLNDRY